MELFVVYDTMGSGRVVGVFDTQEKAEELTKDFPHYYKLHHCTLNQINPNALDWTRNKEQRKKLEEFLKDK